MQNKIVQTHREKVVAIEREEVVVGMAEAVQGEAYTAEAIQEVSFRKSDDELLAVGLEEAQVVSQVAETIIVHDGFDPVPPRSEWPEGVTHWEMKGHKRTKYLSGAQGRALATMPEIPAGS